MRKCPGEHSYMRQLQGSTVTSHAPSFSLETALTFLSAQYANQRTMSLSSMIRIRWGQKTGERFVSITFTVHPQNSLSFCLLYGETMTCNTNNYFSTLLISSDTFSREGKRQFSVFSMMCLHSIGVSLWDDCA